MTSFRDAFKRRAGAGAMRVAIANEPVDKPVEAAPVKTGIPKPPKRK